MVGLTGCHSNPPIVPKTFLPPAQRVMRPIPSYSDLVERYNARLAGLDRLWARTDVKVRWLDEDHEERSESGEGKLIVEPPRRVALTVGKLGHTGLWAGSNDTRYWMFDLQGDKAVYFGDHDKVGLPCTRPLPLPILPASVPNLLGLVPIDPGKAPAPPAVERVNGYWLIEPPGLGARFLLDPKTAEPVRVDLLGPGGYSAVVAQLSGYATVSTVKGSPRIATHAVIYPLNQTARLTLDISDASDGRSGNRINPAVFDLPTLMKLHDPAEVVDLDGRCR